MNEHKGHSTSVEADAGAMCCSIAIMSDAAHMFSDVLSFVVSAYCMRLIGMEASSTYSFGYHRAETIGALVSILIVCVITGGLVVEAIQRLTNPQPIDGKLMFIVSSLGIAFNLLLLFTLGHDHHVHLGGGSCGHSHGHSHTHDHGHSQCGSHGHQPPAELSEVSVDSNRNQQEGTSKEGTSKEGTSKCTVPFLDVEQVVRRHDHVHADNSGHCNGPSHCHSHHDASSPTQGHSHSHPQHHSHSHHHAHTHGHDHSHEDYKNQNLRGAIVHVIGDILQSIGVAIAGAIIWCAPVCQVNCSFMCLLVI